MSDTDRESWIVKGTTRKLITPYLESADQIIFLRFKTILEQYYTLLLRSVKRKERLRDTIPLLIHVAKKRYGWGSQKGKETVEQIVGPYGTKVVTLSSFATIERYLAIQVSE